MSKRPNVKALNRLTDRVNKSPNYLTMVVRGHYVVEQMLERAIENYSHAQSAEVGRLPFGLKVEFATALGVIPRDSRPLFRVFNSLRNRLAHNPFAIFRAKDALDMTNCLSIPQKRVVQGGKKKEPIRDLEKREILWRCILAMYAQLHSRIRDRIRETVTHKLVMEDVSALVDEISKTEHSQREQAAFKAKVEEAVSKIPTF